MAKFAYNNTKNASTGYTSLELSCRYHSQVLFEENVDFYLRSCFTNKLAKELRKLMEICYQNLLYA